MKRFSIFFAVILVFSALLFPFPFRAEVALAQDIRQDTTISGTGYSSFSFLFDGNTTSYKKSDGNTAITLKNTDGIGSLYLLLHKAYGSYTVTDDATGTAITAGENGYLHEYIDLTAAFGYAPTAVTLRFDSGAVQLSEIYVFSEGTPPDYVQIWQQPLEGGADLLLLATHGDDDQLFFAGLLPLYAGEMDLRVQVVYLTDHRSGYTDNARMHEMLDGLWAVGVEAYPVWGNFADFRIDDLKGTYDAYKNSYGTTKNDLLSFVVEQLRRFKPQVVVGHDIDGEYGHGMHMVYTDLLIQALDITADETQFTASAEAYGTWDVPKTYLHLYGENQIVLDYDQPLDYFDGLTAFQATQKLGYPCHKSQQYTWFTRWINGSNNEITKATQIDTYNPCYFGLYRSTVGQDVAKNDFLENITPYARQEADRAAAQLVTDLIDAIGQVTLDSENDLENARNAYNLLTNAQKTLVTNLDTLTAAETAFDTLRQEQAEKEAADRAAAQAVIDLIENLDMTYIGNIRSQYEALTPEQKALVTNYHKLLDAEAQLALQGDHGGSQSQDPYAAEEAELIRLLLLVCVMSLVLVVLLLILRHKRKNYSKRRRR